MSLNEKDKRAHINTLQSLQKDINFLKKASENNPSLEKTMDILRNSQDKLYSALAQHGVTAEGVYRVIMEKNDKAIIKDIMQLQEARNNLLQKLATPNLSPETSQSLETALTQASQQHTAAWDEIINSPDKDRLINKIEQAQIKQQEKEQARDKDRAHELSHGR